MARYRIPIKSNVVDYTLQLPEGSDSSDFTSENDKELGLADANQEDAEIDKKEDGQNNEVE